MDILEKVYRLHDEVIRIERKHNMAHGDRTCVSSESIGGVVTFQLVIKVSSRFLIEMRLSKDQMIVGGLDTTKKPFKFHGIPLYVDARQKEDFKVVTR